MTELRSRAAEAVLAAVTSGTAPFDGTHREWLARLQARGDLV